MKYILYLLILSLLIITSCKESEDPTEPPPPPDPNGELAILEEMKNTTGAGVVKVMTRNIYIGTDVDVVLEAEDLTQVPFLVAHAYNILVKTDINHRASMLADEIAKAEPHLIGLQEVTTVYRQSPGDFIVGNPEQATDELYNYKQILMDALTAKGLNYVVVGEIQGADVELPMTTKVISPEEIEYDDVRIVDHDIILARSDVHVSKPRKSQYQAYLPVYPELGINIYRGYASVEATVNDVSFRFDRCVSTIYIYT